jgi:hypothetical protein
MIEMTRKNEKLVSRLVLNESILVDVEDDEDDEGTAEEDPISIEELFETLDNLKPAEEVEERGRRRAEEEKDEW